MIGLGILLVFGSFWDASELPGRDMSEIPHPPVSETLARLGERVEGDAEVHFIHLNHSNPVCDPDSAERRALETSGAQLATLGDRFEF